MSDDIKGLTVICIALVAIVLAISNCTMQNYKETTAIYQACVDKNESSMECAIVFDRARTR